MTHVPAIYHGLWQRSLYAEPADGEATFVDRDTQVYWLQAGDWHADLRVPADRPEFSGIESLDDCTRDQLVWLASQTAFAGLTRVEGAYCTWHRLIDLSPSLDKDIGVMRFLDDTTLEERHPQGDYRELWSRVATAKAHTAIRHGNDGLPCRLEAGDYAMTIAPRGPIDPRHDLLANPARLSMTALRARAAVDIRLARRDEGGWRVVLATLPWHENRRLHD